MSGKIAGLTACGLLSVVAVPVLLYFAYLGMRGSHLLEIPNEHKTGAAVGSLIAAGMYAATGFFSWQYLKKERMAQEWNQQYRQQQSGTQLRDFAGGRDSVDFLDDRTLQMDSPMATQPQATVREPTPPTQTDFLS